MLSCYITLHKLQLTTQSVTFLEAQCRRLSNTTYLMNLLNVNTNLQGTRVLIVQSPKSDEVCPINAPLAFNIHLKEEFRLNLIGP